MIQGFRDFLFRGNVIDLAVAVVIGAAFNEVVNALVAGLVNPLLAVAVPGNNLNNALLVGPFRFGLIISAIITFVLKAAVVYFVIVRPFAGVAARLAAPTPVAVVSTKDQELLTEIRDELRRSRV